MSLQNEIPKILLIYTGGTIGMIKEYTTGYLKPFDFDQLLRHIPELKQLPCTIDTESFEPPMDSANMDICHWQQLGRIIHSRYTEYDGFVVLHGSDTMAYTASALSFMFEGLRKPIIFTGSQLPIGDLRTDAKENLITAIHIASLRDESVPVVREVCIYFEYKLYRANRTIKISAAHFEAFDSPNYPPLLESGVQLEIRRDLIWNSKKQSLSFYSQLDSQVLICTLFPGLSPLLCQDILVSNNAKAIILRTYGSGTTFTHDWFVDILQEKRKQNIPVINTTQCIRGSVQQGAYETSTHLEKAGVISARDMTVSSALVKSMYLLGQNYSYEQFSELFKVSLRGEIT